HISTCEDCLRTIKIFQAMGVKIEGAGTENLVIDGKGLRGLTTPKDILDAGNSATTMRLVIGVLAGQDFTATITGDQYLQRRPMMRVVQPLRLMGAKIEGREDANFAPLTIKGEKLKAVDYNLPVASAQVKSALLLAALYAKGKTTVSSPALSRDHTERMLKGFGASVKVKNLKVSIKGGARLAGQQIIVPGDISSAAFLIVGATLVKDAELTILNVGINPTRCGFIDALNQMGASIEIKN
ncbi:unnamed protein product, partial [marine sediment metagenome]